MGLLELQRIIDLQQRERQRRHKFRSRNGSFTLSKLRCQRGKRLKYSVPNLPEDIWCHIHSLMPMQDSARVACVSHAFQHAWKRYPNLILTKETLGFQQNMCVNGRSFTGTVDQILKNHSGTGLRTLELDIFHCRDLNPCYLNNWLHISMKPGIENVTLRLPLEYKEGYSFPCSLLFGQSGSSIRHLHLSRCALRPKVGIGCLRSLTKLSLHDVCVTGDELRCLLSNSFALGQLELTRCNEIVCLKIPCVLQRLSSLTVSGCNMLQIIESKAENLSTIDFDGNLVQLSLGSLKVKNLHMECLDETNFLCYAITKLPYIVPSLKSLALSSNEEMVSTPMVAAKFHYLKHLEIYLGGYLFQGYDFLSLVSFLDASPVLETFILGLHQYDMNFDSIFGDATHMRQMTEHKHDSLKDLMIFGFCSAKSMVELTCHILKNATNLECVTLDCVFDQNDEDNTGRCSVTSDRKPGKCFPLCKEMVLEANKGLVAIDRYIAGEVPSTVKLDVRGPCSRCHTIEL